MHLCLFEDDAVRHFSPLTLTRHAADLRLGMFTIAELHAKVLGAGSLSFVGRKEIMDVTRHEHAVSAHPPEGRGILYSNARWVPTQPDVVEAVREFAARGDQGFAFRQDGDVLAAWVPDRTALARDREASPTDLLASLSSENVSGERVLARLWDLLDDVEARLIKDYELLGPGSYEGQKGNTHAHVVGRDVHVAEGARLLPGAVVNAVEGPVWIGEGAVVEENAVVRGPCYVGPRAQVKASGRIDGSAIGPTCKVGGEVHASVFHSLAGKPHDGYVGNSYIGRWCNLGADTNTSNLKNDYGEITMFDAVEGDFVKTGRQFLGLIMGDHSKCSINTMFNTGTVVGVSCNLYGAGFPPRHVPSFSWGGDTGLVEYRLEKALRVAEAVMARRDTPLTEADRQMLSSVFEQSAPSRASH